MDSFLLVAEPSRLHQPTILDYFVNRSTNASAESFKAKLKNFRALVRGGRDTKFHLFRIAKLHGDHHSEQMNPDGVIERMRMTRKAKRKTPSTEIVMLNSAKHLAKPWPGWAELRSFVASG